MQKLTFLASGSSSALYHFCAFWDAAGTTRVDEPNFLVVDSVFADMIAFGPR